MLEANPRASRTVPFASKATGVNLVEAACRLAAGAPLADARRCRRSGRPAQVSVKAAVLPFARFPGADPVLGPEMRSTGEVMATRGRLPDRVREGRARRRAGRCRRAARAFLSVRDADKRRVVPVAARARRARLRARRDRRARRDALAAAGIAVDVVARCREGRRADVVDLIRRGRCDLVVNTPQGRARRTDGYAIREAALVARVPCITTLAGARRGRAGDRARARARPRADAAGAACARRAAAVASPASRRSARTRCCASSAARSTRASRASSSCSRRPGRRAAAADVALPRAAGRARVPDRPDRPGHASALRRSSRATRSRVLGPLGNGFRLDVERPLLVGGGIGIAPLPYLSEALGGPPARARLPQRAPRRGGGARPERRGRHRPELVTEAMPGRAATCSRAARSRCSRPCAQLAPDAQLAWEAPMACGYGACYGCVVEIDGELKRLCVEGPVLCSLPNASGCLDALDAPDVARALDAFVTKTVTPLPREGNAPVRIAETDARDAERDRPREPGPRALPRRDACRGCASSACRSGSRSAASAARRLRGDLRRLDGRRRSSSTSRARTSTRRAESAAEIVAACRAATDLPLYAKLSPATWDIAEVARAVEAAGADGLSLVNTLRGLALDARRCDRRSRADAAGYSGPALKPVALAAVHACCARRTLPIVGMGGVRPDATRSSCSPPARRTSRSARFSSPIPTRRAGSAPSSPSKLSARRITLVDPSSREGHCA